MSDESLKKPDTALIDDTPAVETNIPNDRSAYTVGYGRPPEHGKIKPGEIRNKLGRAKGARSFKKDVNEILNMPVPIQGQDGKRRYTTTRMANLLKLREKALKGDQRSIEKIIDLAFQHAAADEVLANTATLLAEDEAILEHARERDRIAAKTALPALPPPTEEENS